MLPEVTAREVRTLYSAARNDHDLRRAVMFLKLIRYSYSSSCKSFACQPFSLRTLFTLVQDFAKRCENVVIENQDFETPYKTLRQTHNIYLLRPAVLYKRICVRLRIHLGGSYKAVSRPCGYERQVSAVIQRLPLKSGVI